MYRFLVVEYCFADDDWQGTKNVLGSYESMGAARKAAGQYISRNVKRMKPKYRCWQVRVQKERVFFPIEGVF